MATIKYVLITGASTGIGEASARALAQEGFRVFAGVRKAGDMERLVEVQGVEPILLDVTDSGQIEAARSLVAEKVGEAGLWGLFNNAGITVNGPLEFLALDELRRQFEVNVFGQLAVTQAFLPLVRAARGRIVTTGSVGGFVATPVLAPYCMTKFAMEAFSDALRMELAPWEVDVVLLQPAAIATPIWRKGASDAARIRADASSEMLELYEPLIRRTEELVAAQGDSASPPAVVAEALAHALTAKRPRTRYVMGAGSGLRQFLRRLPDRWRDRLMLSSFGWKRGSRVGRTVSMR